jgi:hypothetical protein
VFLKGKKRKCSRCNGVKLYSPIWGGGIKHSTAIALTAVVNRTATSVITSALTSSPAYRVHVAVTS